MHSFVEVPICDRRLDVSQYVVIVLCSNLHLGLSRIYLLFLPFEERNSLSPTIPRMEGSACRRGVRGQIDGVGGEGLVVAVLLQRLLHRSPHLLTRPYLHPDACGHRQAGNEDTYDDLIPCLHAERLCHFLIFMDSYVFLLLLAFA